MAARSDPRRCRDLSKSRSNNCDRHQLAVAPGCVGVFAVVRSYFWVRGAERGLRIAGKPVPPKPLFSPPRRGWGGGGGEPHLKRKNTGASRRLEDIATGHWVVHRANVDAVRSSRPLRRVCGHRRTGERCPHRSGALTAPHLQRTSGHSGPARRDLGTGQVEAQSTVVGLVGNLASDDYDLPAAGGEAAHRSEVIAISEERDDDSAWADTGLPASAARRSMP